MIGLQITDTKSNDLAKYGGTVYICIRTYTCPITADGLEVDQANGKYFEGSTGKATGQQVLDRVMILLSMAVLCMFV